MLLKQTEIHIYPHRMDTEGIGLASSRSLMFTEMIKAPQNTGTSKI